MLQNFTRYQLCRLKKIHAGLWSTEYSLATKLNELYVVHVVVHWYAIRILQYNMIQEQFDIVSLAYLISHHI